ncbi:FIST C-terminal domain-containing protein [filamentous cyanobacterium LEGE 11480]|uniref:FIST C-terminal domain-containing protein n=1 Tax=Romeriopsis navalis LEGE 11480 TaxID=2777977 RepID=A0A928VUU4_9CYAN|nr:FIST N-terminal domain-containing protein [Romeriopsis navalis]MBE9032639.1 FIST C-terminal domain-containing protein [Romeriopsis navalis LEGE 11480]
MLFNPLDIAAVVNWAKTYQHSQEVLVLLVAANSQHQIPELLRALQQHNIACIGGLFTQVIYGAQTFETGCVATCLKSWRSPIMVRDLITPKISLTSLPQLEDLPENQTLAVFADADSPYLAEFLNQLYDRFSNRVQYFGGGAGLLGELSPAEQQCVFTTADGLAKNAAVLAFIDHPGSVSANHGWKRLHGPLIATRTEGNVLLELNWQPAFEVYQSVIESHTGQVIQPADLGTNVSLGFPFGMLKQDAEDIVRLPIDMIPEGGVVCVGGIQPNCVVHILQGQQDAVLAAAHQTMANCSRRMLAAVNHKIVIDCVTRYWFLADRYAEELQAMEQGLASLGKSKVIGALSKGEIASTGLAYLEMLNKSIAVGTFA